MEPGTEQGTMGTTDPTNPGGAGGAQGAEMPGGPSARIGVGGGDENVAKIQLAARWAEQFAPDSGDSLEDALRRFRRAYTYIDSVSKLVDPDTA
jgi:hypothetical protein